LFEGNRLLFLMRVADKLPLALLAGLAGFTAVAAFLVLIGRFETVFVWTFGPLVAFLLGWLAYRQESVKRPGTKKAIVIFDTLAFIAILGWGACNFIFTSQHVLTNRDPATYAVTAAWLSEHNDFNQSISKELVSVKGVHSYSAGFRQDDQTGQMYPQGQHALPAVLGAVGKIIGPVKMLHFNVFFGMMALLAVYCFARLFIRPLWAFTAMMVMAFSLPLMYFSRDVYTEPMLLAFTFGGLAAIFTAQVTRSIWMWLIAGILFAATPLVRIDAYLALVGVTAFFACYVALATNHQERRKRMKELVVFLLPVVPLSLVAWLDLSLLSPAYYKSIENLFILEIVALIGVALAGIVLAILFDKKPTLLKRLNEKTINWRAGAVAGFIIIAGIFIMILPAGPKAIAPNVNSVVTEIQQNSGTEIISRSYTELASLWVSWYVGPIVWALGLGGLAVAAYKAMRDRKMVLLCVLFVILSTALVYFYRPSITPDQIWASRRMLPVIMPGLAIFAAYLVAEHAGKLLPKHRNMRLLSEGALVALIIATPLQVAAPFLREKVLDQQPAIAGVCEALPDKSVILWLGMARLEAVQPTRAYCGAEAYGYHLGENDKPSKATLEEIAQKVRAEGKTPIVGSYSEQLEGLMSKQNQEAMTQVVGVQYADIVSTLTSAPSQVKEKQRPISLGVIGKNGDIAQLP